MSPNQPHTRPSDVHAEQGSVLVDGPDGVAFTLTPEAARETAERLRRKSGEAADQGRPAATRPEPSQ